MQDGRKGSPRRRRPARSGAKSFRPPQRRRLPPLGDPIQTRRLGPGRQGTSSNGAGARGMRDVKGLRLRPDADLSDAPALDVLHVPDGYGQEALMDDEAVLGWIRRQAL